MLTAFLSSLYSPFSTWVQSVRNLGIYIDADLVMRTHVHQTVSKCFAVLRQLRQIRHSVPTETLQTLVIAVVMSRLYYGNAVLVGLPAYLIRRLQSVMNASARMIHRLRSSNHTTDAPFDLHWLRIPERMQFKVAVLVHNVLHGLAPQYLGPLTHVSNLPGRCTLRLTRLNWTYRLFDCRWSGIRRCWPANLEQSASSYDLSRDSYYVQTETQNISV